MQLHPNSIPADDEDRTEITLEHSRYTAYAIFRHSWDSKVRYWPETVFFGGPVLFGRGLSEDVCLEAYIHYPDDIIVRLSERQVTAFMRSAFEFDTTEFGKHMPFSHAAETTYHS